MHKSQRIFSQFGRTLPMRNEALLQHYQQQQQIQTSCLTSTTVNGLSNRQIAPATTTTTKTNFLATAAAPLLYYKNNNSSLLFLNPAQHYSKFIAAREPLGSHPLCEERAFDLVSNLKETELAAIKLAIQKLDAHKQKETFEGKLAATQWRTKFGRLSKVPALGEVDPTGTFCAFPDDWLKKKAAQKAINPSSSDLWKIFSVNAVPFVAFGFLDNFTMIIAGDYIEQLFGAFMCISTMAAAGLGNTISDVLGIGSAYYVERGCEILGLKPPDLTPIQMEMKSSRRAANYGRIIGITVGCLLGMIPLLFMHDKHDKSKEQEPKSKAEAEVVTATAQ